MPIADYVLYKIAKIWPSPKATQNRTFGAEPGSDAYAMAYAEKQFKDKVRQGTKIDIVGKDVLEIGCGHGGISCFLALVGARVIGIDINSKNLQYAQDFVSQVSNRYGTNYSLPVHFIEMNAHRLGLDAASFDIVIADNVFEHFVDPETALSEAYRVLRPGGLLHVPHFSSIRSKYGLHLKHGLKLPWANIFFSEETIIRAMHRLATDDPLLFILYPGLKKDAHTVRDLRAYKDLNDITYSKFKEMAVRVGFEVSNLNPHPVTLFGKIVSKSPVMRGSFMMDILSKSATAELRKPN